MDAWENWSFSPESEKRLNVICSKLKSQNSSEFSKIWLRIFNYGSLVPEICSNEMELDINEDNSTEEEITNLIKESLETHSIFPETKLVGVSFNVLNRVLLSVRNSINEVEFSAFCKFISSWSNTALVEESLKLVVLPKLKEKKEASSCVIFSIKRLTVSKPNEMCLNVLIPLLSEESSEFTDVELLSSVFSVLQPAQQDLLIMKLTEKEEFHESDWMLLQPLLKDLSHNSIQNIINCICNFSYKFTKSQSFGRFLVNFCKNTDIVNDKSLLIKAINEHETLLKRQALKYLESA